MLHPVWCCVSYSFLDFCQDAKMSIYSQIRLQVWTNFNVPSCRNVTNPDPDTWMEKRLSFSTTCWPVGRKSTWSMGSTPGPRALWVLKTWWSSWWKSRERRPRWQMHTTLSRSTNQMKMVSVFSEIFLWGCCSVWWCSTVFFNIQAADISQYPGIIFSQSCRATLASHRWKTSV